MLGKIVVVAEKQEIYCKAPLHSRRSAGDQQSDDEVRVHCLELSFS
jgi:hypothetical protein